MMANIYEPDFDELREQAGFYCRRARIGRQAGTRDLGASLWEIPPVQAAYPFHYHLAEEELIVVLQGSSACAGPTAGPGSRRETWVPSRAARGAPTRS